MGKYYLFLKSQRDLDHYYKEFCKVSKSIEDGVTPVFCEMRAAKTGMIETIPYNIISAVLIICGTVVLSKIGINEIISVGITLVINDFCSVLSNYIFTVLKHKLRLRLCLRLGIEPTEHNIAVMESMEYQSV